MTRSFGAFSLAREQIPVVFPLVQAAMPEVDLARWGSFARPLIENQPEDLGGIIGLRNKAGYICGLLVYKVTQDLRRGAVLAIDLFTALDLVSEETATRTLLDAAEHKARELCCAAMLIRLDKNQGTVSRHFAAAGHHPQATVFCKAVAPAPLAS